jgi:short-subunit dehydrogenase
VDYAASKFAVTGYMEALRQELYDTGVHASMVFPGLINTGMFDGVLHSFPYLTPPLEIENVAQAMLDILESNRSQEVPLPFYVRPTPILRCLPVEINDWVHRWTGSTNDLKSFKGTLSEKKLKERE